MMQKISKLSLFLLFTSVSFAEAYCPPMYAPPPLSYYQIGAGYRLDDIRWQLNTPEDFLENFEAITNDTITGESVVRFRDLSIFLLNASGKYYMNSWFCAKGLVDYGWIFNRSFDVTNSFDFTDSDGNEFTNSILTTNTIGDSHVADLSAAVGYHGQYMAEALTVSILLGYSYHEVNFHKGGEMSVTDVLVEEGLTEAEIEAIGFVNLKDSGYSYTNEFWGPWVGADLNLNMGEDWFVYLEGEYHFASTCHIKRHSDTGSPYFDKYAATCSAHGAKGKLGANYMMGSNLFIGMDFTYSFWSMNHQLTTHVYWRSVSFEANFGYVY